MFYSNISIEEIYVPIKILQRIFLEIPLLWLSVSLTQFLLSLNYYTSAKYGKIDRWTG